MIFKLKERTENRGITIERIDSIDVGLGGLKSKKYIFDNKKRLKKGLKWINKMGKGGYIHTIYTNEIYNHEIRKSICSCEIKYFSKKKDNQASAWIHAGVYGDSKKVSKVYNKSVKKGFNPEREVMIIDGKYLLLFKRLKGMNDPQMAEGEEDLFPQPPAYPPESPLVATRAR